MSSSLKRPPPKAHTSPHITASTTTSSTNTSSPTNSPISANAKFLDHLYEKDNAPQSPPKTPRRRPHRALMESPPRPTTPTNARLTRPVQPPPVKRKILPDDLRRRKKPTLTVRELFRSAHPLAEDSEEETSNNNKNDGLRSPLKGNSPIKQQATNTNISSPHKQEPSTQTTTTTNESTVAESLGLKKLILPATPPATPRKNLDKLEKFRQLHKLSPKKVQPESPSKITSGPLKGISTSLLDLIRAKEAKAKESPEQLRQRELLGIAPEIARIVPTLFTAHKRDIMPHEKVVDKCFKALRSNYSTFTIIECLDLMDKVAPEWVTIVEISRGKFMRLNKDKYTMPQLLQAIKRYKGEKCC